MKRRALFSLLLLLSANTATTTTLASATADFETTIESYYNGHDWKARVLKTDENERYDAALVVLEQNGKITTEKLSIVVREKAHPDLLVTKEIAKKKNISVLDYQLALLQNKNNHDFVAFNGTQYVALYDLTKQTLVPVVELPLKQVEFLPNKSEFEKIKGMEILSFCDICDDPSEGDPLDILFIPVEISVSNAGTQVACLLNQRAVSKLKKTFSKREKLNRKRAFWTNRAYSVFLRKLETQFEEATANPKKN